MLSFISVIWKVELFLGGSFAANGAEMMGKKMTKFSQVHIQ